MIIKSIIFLLYLFSICIYLIGIYSVNLKIKSNKENYELIKQCKKHYIYIVREMVIGFIPIVNFLIGVMLIKIIMKMDDSEIKKVIENRKNR
ncbi:hypothetical protein M1R13_018070 [Clostridioides difficile]|nr:hypothetical protein [Clostridioides difficile]